MDYLVIQQTATETIFARFRRQRRALFFEGATRQLLVNDLPLTDLAMEQGKLADTECRIILALASGDLFFRELTLPLLDRRKLREILPLELKGETALDTDDMVFDSVILDGGKVLAIWGRRTAIAEAIGQLEGCGLEPELVTCSLFAWQSILPDEALGEGCITISDGDSLAVFKSGAPLFFRALSGENRAAEVSSTLTALEIGHGIKVDRFYIHGCQARQREMLSLPLAEPLPVGGRLADAFGGDEAVARELAGAFAVVTTFCFGDPLNFRSGPLTYTRELDRIRKKLRLTATLAAVFVTLIFAQVGLRYYQINKDLGSLNASIKAIYRKLFPDRKKAVDEVGELRSEIKRLGADVSSDSVLQILKKLAEAKTDGITGVYETDIDGGQVRLKGDARSIQAVNDFKIKTAAAFANAEVSEIRSRPDGTVSFQFKGTFKGEEK